MDLHKLALYNVFIFLWLYFLSWLLFPLSLFYFWFTQICLITILSVVTWTLAHFLYDFWNTETVVPDNKIVLITGCDTGFGHQLAQKLDSYGFHVFAGVLFPEESGAKYLKENCSKRMSVLKMDVTKAEDVENVMREIDAQTKMSLWAVVNNAGIAIECPFDWGKDVDEYKKIFEVNVFGLVKVTKNCISLLRKSKGRVINMASISGRLTVPIMGHYCMTKNSVRVFSDVLRRELYMDGVQVVTIEPTLYQTEILNLEQIKRAQERIFNETPSDIKEAYNNNSHTNLVKNMGKLTKMMARRNINEVVTTLVNAVTLVSPKPFYRCCGYHDVALWAASLMPETILDVMICGFVNSKWVVQLGQRFISLFKRKQ